MKAIKPVLILASVLMLASSCVFRVDTKRIMNLLSSSATLKASRVYVTKDTTVASFSSLIVSNSISVSFVQDSTRNSVSVFASDNVMPYVGVSIDEDECLKISLDPDGKLGPFVDWGDINVVLYAPSFSEITVAGSGSFKCNHLEVAGNFDAAVVGSGEVSFGTLAADSISLTIAGSGEFDIETLRSDSADIQVSGSGDVDMKYIDVQSISAEITGSGELDLSGKAGKASYYIAGSGEVDAEKLVAKETTTSVSGSGSITYQDSEGRVKTANRSNS